MDAMNLLEHQDRVVVTAMRAAKIWMNAMNLTVFGTMPVTRKDQGNG